MPKGIPELKNQLISGKGCYQFLIERDDTQKKIKICNQLLDSICKSRGSRKAKYVENLKNALTKLCIDSSDLINTCAKLKTSKKDCSRESAKRAQLCDKLIAAQYENSQLSEYKARYENQLECTFKIEQDYRKLLSENNILKERIQKLQEKQKKRLTNCES